MIATSPLSWEVYSSRFNLMRADAPGEKWQIGAKRASEPVKISFFLNDGRSLSELIEAERATNIEENSYEYWRYASLLGTDLDNQGYAATAADAQALIEVLRTGDTGSTVEELLAKAGFEFQHAFDRQTIGKRTVKTRVFYKTVGRAFFTLFVSTDGIHLTFEKDGRSGSENLAAFWSKGECYDGKPLPVFWPERLGENFDVLALRACLTMVERYMADGRHLARKARTKAA